jgi:ureidoacrylate peracid hydrolase
MAVRTDSRYAVVSLGMQNDYLDPSGFFRRRGHLDLSESDRALLVGNVRRILDLTRAAQRPVVHAVWRFRPDHLDCSFAAQWKRKGLAENGVLVDGTWGSELVQGLEVEQDDFELFARAHSAFEFTHLDRLLRNCGVETVVLIGGMAADAIDDTARQGAAYGYRILVVDDAIFPFRSPHIKTLRSRADTISTDELVRMIEFDAMPRPTAPGLRGVGSGVV